MRLHAWMMHGGWQASGHGWAQEVVTDLLAPDQRARLALREDLARGVYVEGLSEETVTSGSLPLSCRPR